VEVGNAGNSPRVLTLKQWPMVETMTKMRTIDVTGNVGKTDMLRRGSSITRKEEEIQMIRTEEEIQMIRTAEEIQMRRTAGITKGVEVTRCIAVSGIIILEGLKVLRLSSEGILDQESWVLEGLQFQWNTGGICRCALWVEDIHDLLQAWWHPEG
jgi:hypothetical protein